jgi:hypothetical protein
MPSFTNFLRNPTALRVKTTAAMLIFDNRMNENGRLGAIAQA